MPEAKKCPICGTLMHPVSDRLSLCMGTSYETTRWDCPHCGAQSWDGLWEEQERRKKSKPT